jgi:hypothetical protein
MAPSRFNAPSERNNFFCQPVTPATKITTHQVTSVRIDPDQRYNVNYNHHHKHSSRSSYMLKHIGFAIVLVSLVAGVAIWSTPAVGVSKQDIKRVIQGILSPDQISTLIGQHRDFRDQYSTFRPTPPDLGQIWQELQLNEKQVGQVLRLADSKIDEIMPALLALGSTGQEATGILFAADQNNPQIPVIAEQMAQKLANLAEKLRAIQGQAQPLLSEAQWRILEAHHLEHRQQLLDRLTKLPEISAALAAGWEKLQLSPQQIDALTILHTWGARNKFDQLAAAHSELQRGIETIITPQQQPLFQELASLYGPAGAEHFRKKFATHEQFRTKLQLSGEQKSALIQIVITNRQNLVSAVQGLGMAAIKLHQVDGEDIPTEQGQGITAKDALSRSLDQILRIGSGLMAEANQVLTTTQGGLLRNHVQQEWAAHLETAENLSSKLHDGTKRLAALQLSPEQLGQILALVTNAQKSLHHVSQ